MRVTPVTLDIKHRLIVEATIKDHCFKRNWTLHAVNCRTNHVHSVITAIDASGQTVRDQLKAWCSRRLNELSHNGVHPKWWSQGGSIRVLFNDEALAVAVQYATDAQEKGGSSAERSP